MKIKHRTLWGVAGVTAVVGLVALSGASYAQRALGFGGHGFGMMGGLAQEVLRDVDADRSGGLSQQEINQSLDARYARFDADRNGSLSLDEFNALWTEFTRPLTVRAFQMLDPNGDAALARAEVDERFARLVQRFDRNGDGALSPDDRPRWAGRHDRDHDRR